MPRLPDRPDLDQLRRQARDRQRAARREGAEVTTTLTAAQLSLARELGFSSWTALTREVAAQRDRHPVVRPVKSRAELAAVFDVAGAQIVPPMTHDDRRFADLDRRFDDDRALMLVAEGDGILGGALAFRAKSGDVALRVIGLVPTARGRGLGRQLVEAVEREAMALGCRTVAAGGITPQTRGFYERLRFRGRHSMMSKDLPPRRLTAR